jgi:hypothetical protein
METSVAAVLSRMGHWENLDMGSEWFSAGQDLAEHDTTAASKAYIWAGVCYKTYDDAWHANGSSRWDPDGSAEITQANEALAQLYTVPAVTAALPEWVGILLEGVVPVSSDVPENQLFLSKLAKVATGIRALS